MTYKAKIIYQVKIYKKSKAWLKKLKLCLKKFKLYTQSKLIKSWLKKFKLWFKKLKLSNEVKTDIIRNYGKLKLSYIKLKIVKSWNYVLKSWNHIKSKLKRSKSWLKVKMIIYFQNWKKSKWRLKKFLQKWTKLSDDINLHDSEGHNFIIIVTSSGRVSSGTVEGVSLSFIYRQATGGTAAPRLSVTEPSWERLRKSNSSSLVHISRCRRTHTHTH